MPEEHGALKHKVPVSGDYSPGQADVPRAFREYDDDVTDDLVRIEALLETPACKVTRSTNLGLALETPTLVEWDTESYDTSAMHSTSSNKDRIVAPKTGLYLCSGQLVFDSPEGIAVAIIFQSGSAIPLGRATAEHVATSGSTSEKVATFSIPVPLKAGAYVSVSAYTKKVPASVIGAGAAGVAPPSELALTLLGPYPS